MTLEVLLSAMNLENRHYIDSLFITGDCVIINQCNSTHMEQLEEDGRHITYVQTEERGLSKSRNMALRLASADICILCDNDVEYHPAYEETILKAYEK